MKPSCLVFNKVMSFVFLCSTVFIGCKQRQVGDIHNLKSSDATNLECLQLAGVYSFSENRNKTEVLLYRFGPENPIQANAGYVQDLEIMQDGCSEVSITWKNINEVVESYTIKMNQLSGKAVVRETEELPDNTVVEIVRTYEASIDASVLKINKEQIKDFMQGDTLEERFRTRFEESFKKIEGESKILWERTAYNDDVIDIHYVSDYSLETSPPK